MTSVSLNGSSNKSQQSFTINNKRKSSPVDAAPNIAYSDLLNDKKEVKRRTGFTSLEHMLSYAVVYYAGNCAKGGVFLQLCGWTGVESLWVGATSDSHYQEHTNIFGKQQAFAEQDKVDGKIIPFTNIFDKGYRVNLPAWRVGRQQVIQPNFARSDRKFNANETIRSANIATDRSGNERAVDRCKLSGYIKRGIHQTMKPSTMDNVWLAWSFQTNFMYKPIL